MKQGVINRVIMKEERQSEGFRYTYELILGEGVRTADWRLPLYSIRISMTDGVGNTSKREAEDLFTDSVRAVEFFKRLVRNLATPIDLGYVIEDELRS